MKGKIYTDQDVPKRLRARTLQMQRAWIESQTDRYRIIARDESAPAGKQEIIREELEPRIIARLPEKARRIVTLLTRMSAPDRIALLQAFDETGALRNPFTMV